MGWNGADLVSDFSAELGDTTSAFQTKVLRWINDGIRDIATAHEWSFLRKKGKAILAANTATNSIVIDTPTAPSVAALAGGSLTADVEYKVLVTFYEGVSGAESIAGAQSAGITPTGTDLSITLTDIPVSTSPLVTARKIYISVSGGVFYLYSTISNNTATTSTVTANTTSTQEPPDESAILSIDGDLFIEELRTLALSTVGRLTYETNGVTAVGTPTYWAPISNESVLVHPIQSSSTTVSFYYFKRPAKVVNSTSSIPEIPSFLFEDLHNYVIWRGYQYRDRAGKESMKMNYDQGLRLTISRKGKPFKGSGRVRSVTPDSDGYLV